MREAAIKEIKIESKILRIFLDENAENPREWDNLAKMIFFGKQKHLGDKHDISLSGSFSDKADFILKAEGQIRKQIKDIAIIKPVQMYSHSGSSISTNTSYPFNCPWDSGTIGFAIITNTDIKKEYSIKRVTKKELEKAELVLEYEVETLNQYITGDTYGFEVIAIETCDKGYEHVTNQESCFGFYGSDFATNGIIDHISDERLSDALKAA